MLGTSPKRLWSGWGSVGHASTALATPAGTRAQHWSASTLTGLRRLRRETPLAASHDRQAPTLEPAGLDAWLVSAWAGLSPHQRTAVALRYLLDLDVEDIAKHMGCSSGTVRAHLSRGLRRLRDRSPRRPDVGEELSDA